MMVLFCHPYNLVTSVSILAPFNYSYYKWVQWLILGLKAYNNG